MGVRWRADWPNCTEQRRHHQLLQLCLPWENESLHPSYKKHVAWVGSPYTYTDEIEFWSTTHSRQPCDETFDSRIMPADAIDWPAWIKQKESKTNFCLDPCALIGPPQPNAPNKTTIRTRWGNFWNWTNRPTRETKCARKQVFEYDFG